MNETAQKPKCTIFQSLLGGEEVYIFHLFLTIIEDNLAEYLILITQDWAMKFLPQAAQYPGHLWKQNHDDKLLGSLVDLDRSNIFSADQILKLKQ